MIKRYTAASGTATANESWVTRPISINRRSICLAEDVSALEKKVYDLETENAELRERVGELEEVLRKKREVFRFYAGLHYAKKTKGGMRKAKNNEKHVKDIDAVLSPVDVEKGEEG